MPSVWIGADHVHADLSFFQIGRPGARKGAYRRLGCRIDAAGRATLAAHYRTIQDDATSIRYQWQSRLYAEDDALHVRSEDAFILRFFQLPEDTILRDSGVGENDVHSTLLGANLFVELLNVRSFGSVSSNRDASLADFDGCRFERFLPSASDVDRCAFINERLRGCNLAAIAGAPLFGHLSENVGRRRAMMFALGVSLLSMPAWAFGTSLFTLAIGSCVMQAGVQGAFGVIPAHLNELSPDAIRSLFPGFLYQLGVLIASPAVSVEYFMQKRLGYPWTLTLFEATVMIALFIIFALGPERKGRSFYGVR
jgi:hypothetical protein